MITLLATVLALTPADCRAVGVLVDDGAPVAGVVVEATKVGKYEARGYCKGITGGCALNVWAGYGKGLSEWVIFYSDDYSYRHEWCHAVFVEPRHTPEHDRR